MQKLFQKNIDRQKTATLSDIRPPTAFRLMITHVILGLTAIGGLISDSVAVFCLISTIEI